MELKFMLDSNTLCNIIKEVFKLDDSHIVLPKVRPCHKNCVNGRG